MVVAHLRPLFPYLKRYSSAYIWGGICILLMNGTWVLFPPIIGRAIDGMRQTGVTLHQIGVLALMLLAVSVVKAIFQFLIRWVLIGASREIEFDLRNDLFRHLEGLSHSFYQRTRTGDFMLKISHRLTFYAFLPLPIVSIVIQYFGRRIHERFERIQAMFSDISARAQENFSGARVIRAYVQEEAEIAAFENANQEYIRRSLGLVRLMGMLWPTLELMLGAAVVIVLWLGGREVLLGKISVGKFVTFNTYMVQLTWPVIALGWVINIFQRGTASLARINEIFLEKPEIADDRDLSPVAPQSQLAMNQVANTLTNSERHQELRGEIEFCNLNFGYNGVPILKDVNLRIPAGSSLAIVGPTGSGKTTLVSLIARIYDAEPGAVLIDGRPIREFPLETLRRNIGFVPQETFLFSLTIRENIALGRDDAC